MKNGVYKHVTSSWIELRQQPTEQNRKLNKKSMKGIQSIKLM